MIENDEIIVSGQRIDGRELETAQGPTMPFDFDILVTSSENLLCRKQRINRPAMIPRYALESDFRQAHPPFS
jgi:hypothetical protein